MNIRLETIKLLEENTGAKRRDAGVHSGVWDLKLKAKGTKAKITTWEDAKLKSFLMTKEAIEKIKGDLPNGGRCLQTTFPFRARHRKYTRSCYNQQQKTDLKMGKGPEQMFSFKEDVRMASRLMRRCST